MKNPDFEWSENDLEARLYIQYSVADISLSFEPFLYQTANYLNLTNFDKKFSFYLFRTGEISSIACIHFGNIKTNCVSQPRAPFGGIQCDEKCNTDEINFLFRCIENWSSSQNNRSITFKGAPTCYNSPETNHLLTNAYKTSDYKNTDTFINYHIPISQSPFFHKITSAEKRRLNKCKRSGFFAGLYDKPNSETVYNFIRESRAAKGYLMSMTLEQLNEMMSYFPQRCLVFKVTDKSKIIALTVTILVCKGVLYNFLPADLPDYKNFSPMVFLTEAIYDYCQKEEISILDMGISTDQNGIEKPGLLRFKKNLGGIESLKTTYEKKIELRLVD